MNVIWTALQFNKEGSIIGTASNEATLRLWSAKSGEPKGTPANHEPKLKLRKQVDDYAMVKG